jgi:hypothetical protein
MVFILKLKKVKVFLLAKLKRSFASQVYYGARNVNEASRSLTAPCTISNGFDLDTPIHLQLSQPQPQNNAAPQKAIELGYILNLMTSIYNLRVLKQLYHIY